MRPLNSGLAAWAILAFFLPSASVLAQMRHTTAPADSHQHIFAIVPITGSGTIADPKRPMFAPAQVRPVVTNAIGAAAATSAPRTGIVAYHMQVTDDGKSAIVEFIAPSLSDLKDILTTSDSRVQVFRKGVQSKDAMEAAFKTRKKDFSFDKFHTAGVQ